MFEHVSDELISVNRFFVRMATFFGVATSMLIFGVVPGVLGFVWIEGMAPEQALVNALSLLGGIEPPFELTTGDGYLFMAVYGLFIETVFFLAVATLLAPVVHRIFHRMHLKIG